MNIDTLPETQIVDFAWVGTYPFPAVFDDNDTARATIMAAYVDGLRAGALRSGFAVVGSAEPVWRDLGPFVLVDMQPWPSWMHPGLPVAGRMRSAEIRVVPGVWS